MMIGQFFTAILMQDSIQRGNVQHTMPEAIAAIPVLVLFRADTIRLAIFV